MYMKLPAFLAAAVAACALNAAPTVSDVTIAFDEDSRMMTIGYSLSEDAVVTVDILTNNVSIGAEKFADVAGDVNGVVKAGRGTISWRPEHLWPDQLFTTPLFTAKVSAWKLDEPPPYLVVWITEEKGKVRYYESEKALPGGITNVVYRAKRLVMRRIPAKGVTWLMGSPENETGRQANEVQHYVSFKRLLHGRVPCHAGAGGARLGGEHEWAQHVVSRGLSFVQPDPRHEGRQSEHRLAQHGHERGPREFLGQAEDDDVAGVRHPDRSPVRVRRARRFGRRLLQRVGLSDCG